MYNFEDILDRKSNGSKKWNKEYIKKRFNIEYEDEVYPLFIADMDFKLPKEIIDPVIDIIREADFGYFDISDSFYDNVQKWYLNQYNSKIKKEWIVPSVGALTTMNLILESIFNKEDKILIFTPVYGPFRDVINNNGLELVSSKLCVNNNTYKIDFNDLEEKIKDVKGIILCNPHNPSGKCWSSEELDKLVKLCHKEDVIIISDEVHGDLVLKDKTFVTLANYIDKYDKHIILSSLNKTFNLAGLNISTFLCNNDNIRNLIADKLNNNKVHVNRIGYEISNICYENGYEWLEELKSNINENVKMTLDKLKGLDLEVITPEAGYLVWVKLNKVKDIDKFILDLAKDKKVLLETGSRFIKDYENYLRINLATSKKILEEGINRFVDFYNNYN